MSSKHASRIIGILHAAMDFSVDMVAEGLCEVPEIDRDAVCAEVIRHVVQYQHMSASICEMAKPGMNWSSIVEREQDAEDLPYVRMTPSEFEAEKHRAKRDRRFPNWVGWRDWVERIDSKRRVRPSAPPRRSSPLNCLYAERNEILRYPAAMFATEASRDAALYEVEAEIRRLGGRVEHTDEERETVTSIDARLRQARALKSCRRFIAAEVIRKFIVKNSRVAECVYCFDTFKSKNGEIFCSRSCEKFAMRGKYD